MTFREMERKRTYIQGMTINFARCVHKNRFANEKKNALYCIEIMPVAYNSFLTATVELMKIAGEVIFCCCNTR